MPQRARKQPKLTLGVVTDIHHGETSGARLGHKALPLLKNHFAKAVADKGPAAVIELGDRITAGNKTDAARYTKDVMGVFNAMACPHYHIDGNHDRKYLPSSGGSYSVDLNGYHLSFLNFNVTPDRNGSYHAAPEDLLWLQSDLAATRMPTVVFSHLPLCNEKTDNERAESLRGTNPFYYAEGAAIRDIMEKSGKVILCMAGHRHEAALKNINGIHYFTQQSLSQEWKKKYHVPHGTYSFIDRRLKFSIHQSP